MVPAGEGRAGIRRLALETFGPAEGLEHERVEVVADAGVARSCKFREPSLLDNTDCLIYDGGEELRFRPALRA